MVASRARSRAFATISARRGHLFGGLSGLVLGHRDIALRAVQARGALRLILSQLRSGLRGRYIRGRLGDLRRQRGEPRRVDHPAESGNRRRVAHRVKLLQPDAPGDDAVLSELHRGQDALSPCGRQQTEQQQSGKERQAPHDHFSFTPMKGWWNASSRWPSAVRSSARAASAPMAVCARASSAPASWSLPICPA